MYGSNTSYERFAGVPNTLNSAADFAALAALGNAAARLTRPVHLGAMTRMRGINGKPGIPMINGKFKAIIAPEVMGDLRQDQTWVNTAVFNNTPKIAATSSKRNRRSSSRPELTAVTRHR
jgi:hypothetical protein